MLPLYTFMLAAFAASAQASPVAAADAAGPLITPAPEAAQLAKRTSCTFSGSNGASSASKSQKSCATIVMSGVTVPSGTTLDLSDLEDGTHVIFEGVTTFGYKEWAGPLMQIKGTDITIECANGGYIDAKGALWWDGEGGSGGKTKPKFFYAHSLTNSAINNFYVLNTPLQAISIDGASGLTITNMTINNQAGDSLGKNTDGFDVGDSSDVTITNSNVYNQDDCIAINSGTVRSKRTSGWGMEDF